MNALITLTPKAVDKIRDLLAQSTDAAQGLRISVNTKGCSGHAYQFDYVREAKPTDELIEQDGVKVFVDFAATMYLVGSVMHWSDSDIKSGFEFSNPNESGRCGCGESFYVDKEALAQTTSNG